MTRLEPCDLFFTRGDTLLAYLIRRATRDRYEAPTWAGHVGCVVQAGDGLEAICVEALNRVERHSLKSQYEGKAVEIRVFRPLCLNEEQKATIIRYLEQHVNDKYGYGKILLHGAHWITGWDWWLKMSVLDKFPICSYLIAKGYGFAGYYFGVEPGQASPDDMMDDCLAHPDCFAEVARFDIS